MHSHRTRQITPSFLCVLAPLREKSKSTCKVRLYLPVFTWEVARQSRQILTQRNREKRKHRTPKEKHHQCPKTKTPAPSYAPEKQSRDKRTEENKPGIWWFQFDVRVGKISFVRPEDDIEYRPEDYHEQMDDQLDQNGNGEKDNFHNSRSAVSDESLFARDLKLARTTAKLTASTQRPDKLFRFQDSAANSLATAFQRFDTRT